MQTAGAKMSESRSRGIMLMIIINKGLQSLFSQLPWARARATLEINITPIIMSAISSGKGLALGGEWM